MLEARGFPGVDSPAPCRADTQCARADNLRRAHLIDAWRRDSV